MAHEAQSRDWCPRFPGGHRTGCTFGYVTPGVVFGAKVANTVIPSAPSRGPMPRELASRVPAIARCMSSAGEWERFVLTSHFSRGGGGAVG